MITWRDFFDSWIGDVVEAKYQYSRYIAHLTTPARELLRFLSDEQDNFSVEKRGSTLKLVWHKGQIHFPLGWSDVIPHITDAGYYQEPAALNGYLWATREERWAILLSFCKVSVVSYAHMEERKRLAGMAEANHEKLMVTMFLEDKGYVEKV